MTDTVNTAMAEERPEKQTMRQIWVERILDAPEPGEGEPLFLTLAGAEGLDVQALVEAEVIGTTETGAILAADKDKVIAVEAREEAFLSLSERFKGLRILKARIEHLLKGEHPFNWPVGEHLKLFRARVINLDFDGPLRVGISGGQLVFPQITWIRKVADIHAHETPLDWTLFLTFQSEIHWPEEAEARVKTLLADNFERSADYSQLAERLLGETPFAGIRTTDQELRLSELERSVQQRLLMALVPKKICRELSGSGWRVVTRNNLHYGGAGRRAPMVSFVFDLRWDERGTSEPDAVYLESLLDSIAEPARIDGSGELRSLD
jgi:hypothetical protein